MTHSHISRNDNVLDTDSKCCIDSACDIIVGKVPAPKIYDEHYTRVRIPHAEDDLAAPKLRQLAALAVVERFGEVGKSHVTGSASEVGNSMAVQ